MTAPPHDPAVARSGAMPTALLENPQTVTLLQKLGIGRGAPEPEVLETNPELIDLDSTSSSSGAE